MCVEVYFHCPHLSQVCMPPHCPLPQSPNPDQNHAKPSHDANDSSSQQAHAAPTSLTILCCAIQQGYSNANTRLVVISFLQSGQL
jgi:hypothetical protein